MPPTGSFGQIKLQIHLNRFHAVGITNHGERVLTMAELCGYSISTEESCSHGATPRTSWVSKMEAAAVAPGLEKTWRK